MSQSEYAAAKAAQAAFEASGGAAGNSGGSSQPLNTRKNNRWNQAGQNKVEQYKDLQDASKIASYGNDDKGRGRNSYARQAIADERSAKTGISQNDAANILYNFYSGGSNLSQQDVQSMSQKQAAFNIRKSDPSAASILTAQANGMSSSDYLAKMQNDYDTAGKAVENLSGQLEALNSLGPTTYDSFGGGVLNKGYDKAQYDDINARLKEAESKREQYGKFLEDARTWDRQTRAVSDVNASAQQHGSYKLALDDANTTIADLEAKESELQKIVDGGTNVIASLFPGINISRENPEESSNKLLSENELSAAQMQARKELEQVQRDLADAKARKKYATSMLASDPISANAIRLGKENVESYKRVWEGENKQWNAWEREGLAGLGDSADAEQYRQTVEWMHDFSNLDWGLPTDKWSKGEQDIFYSIAYHYGVEQALEYGNEINRAYTDAESSKKTGVATEWGAGADQEWYGKMYRGIVGAAAQVGLTPVHMVSWFDKMITTAQNQGHYVGRENPWITDYSNALVSGRAGQLNKDYGTLDLGVLGERGWGDAYQVGISVAQSMALGHLTGQEATLLNFFGQAADNGWDEAIQRGANEEQAMLYSVFTGIAETLGEHWSIENLLDDTVDVSTFTKLAKQVFKQGMIEGSEEAFTDVLNLVGDALAGWKSGGQSEMRQMVQQLMANGVSYDEAVRSSWKKFADDVLWDAASGFLSGAVSAGLEHTPTYFRERGAQNIQRAQQYKDTELINQNRTAIESGNYSGIFNNQLVELAKAAYRQGDTATYEKLLAEFTARAQKGELNDLGLNLDFGADTQRLANALREQLETAAIQEAREGYVDTQSYDENGQPFPVEAYQQEEQAPVPADSEEGYRNQNEIFEQMQARADEAAVAQQRAQALARQQEEQNRQTLQQQAEADANESFNRRLADTTPYTVEDVLSRTTAKTTADYVAALREAIQQNPQLADQILDARPSNYGGRSAIGRAIKQLQTELSTNTTGTGTIEASNTQEVANGQSAVQESAASAGEGKRASGSQVRDNTATSAERQRSSSSGSRSSEASSGDRKRLVELNESDLSAEEQASAPTEFEKEWIFDNLADDAVVIRSPGIGTIAHLMWRAAKALHIRDFYIARSQSGKAFTDGSAGYHSVDYDAVVSSITGNAVEDVDTILHEGIHEKMSDAFGNDIASGSYSSRMIRFVDIFIDSADAAGFDFSKAMQDALNFVTDRLGYGKRYEKYHDSLVKSVSADLAKAGVKDADSKAETLVTESEKARALEEFFNLVITENADVKEYLSKRGIFSEADLEELRKNALGIYQEDEILTGAEISSIDSFLQEAKEFDNTGLSAFGADRKNLSNLAETNQDSFNLNRAIRQAASGDVKSLTDYELQAVLNYALDRVSPETKGDPILDRATNILLEHADEVGRNAQPIDWSSDTGYRGNSAGSLDTSQSESLISTVSAILNELDKRGVSVDEKAEGTISRYANRFGIDEIGNQQNNRSRSEMTIQERQAETDNGPTEFQQEEDYRKGKMRQDLEALRIAAETKEKGKPLGRNGNYVEEAIPTKPGQNGWISNLEQNEITAEEAEEMFFKSQELEDDIDDLNRQIKEAEDRGDMGALPGLYKKLGSLTKQLNTISKRMTSSAMVRTSFRNEMRRELQRERLQEARKPKAADMRPGAGNRTDFLSETGWPQSAVDRAKALDKPFRSAFTDRKVDVGDILSGETYTAAEGEQTQQRAKPAPDGVSALRQSMEKILNGEGDLFRAETEADQAPAHDDTDDPRHKLTKEEREAQRQRVGESPSGIKPVSADVVQGMLHVQEAVKGILDSNRPVRHVMNLANSITDFSADGHEMNWLATKEIKQTADDIKAIFEDGHIENDQKAQMMAEATVKLMNQVAARTARAEMFRKLGFEFTEHANKNGTGNMDAKGLKAFNQWAKSMQLNPTTAFKMVDGFDAGGNGIGYQIARQIQDSVALEQMLTASVHGQYHKLAGMEGLQDFVEGKSKSPVTVPGVGTITEQQAVEFIKSIRTLANQKVGNKSRLETITGFTFLDKNGNRTEVKKSNFKSSKESSFYEDMRRLENEMLIKLSPAARKYLEITDDILFDLGKRVSKTKQQVTGVGFADFRKGDYYPVKYGRSERTIDYTDSGEQSGIFDPFTDRTRKIGGYVEIGSAADTVDRYIQRSVYAAAYGDLSDELQFLNSSALGMRGMANSAGDAFGKSFARLFNNYTNDVAGISTEDQSGAAEMFKKGRLALQQGALRFSISVPIKQVASYWDAAGILSPEALVKAYRFKGVGAKGLGAENQLLAYRKVGNIDPTLSERLNDKGYVSELKKKSGVVRAFDLATNTMDYRTVDNLFTATIVDTHMAFPEMDINSKQFKDIVAARFQDVVLQTQPVFNRNARSENQRTSNELIRMVSMFRTQQTQNYNRMVTALGEARAAKGTKLEAAANKQLKQTITGQVLASMEFGLLSIVADMARHKLKPYRKDDDDDRISAEKIMKRFALNSIESAAGTVWFGDQVAKAMLDIAAGDSSDSGGEFYGLNFGMLSSMGSALNGTVETAGTIAKAIRTGDWSKVSLNNLRYAVTNAAQVFGIPANNVANLINSLAMYSLDAVDYATGHKSGNRGVYDNALKMFDDMLRGEYTSNTAKHQADKFFRTGDAENLLYNIALLEQDGREKAEKAGGDDPHKGHNYLANLLGTEKAKEAEVDKYGRKLSANERIANYLVDSNLDAEAIDTAVNEYANSGGYNVFYNALRAQGMKPVDAVNELYKSDNKTGMTTQIYDEDNVNLLLSGVDAPGDTYDVPPLEQRNLDEYVDYATAAKVYIETKNYDELDKLIDSYNDLDENTRAVLEAKDSNLIHLRECSDLGVGSAEYYGLKDTMKDVQVEMDKSTATGSALKLVAMGRANLTDKQRDALLESDWMGISKTGKIVYNTLSKYGMSMEDVGQWISKTDYSRDESNGTLSNVEVAQALRNTPGLTDNQRRAIYEELKPQLTNPYKINDWGRYTYDSEIAYIDRKGLEVGKWD